MAKIYKLYDVWRQAHSETTWVKTAHSVSACSDKDAASKVKRKFEGCGFTSMSLVAVLQGSNPNVITQ